MHTLLELNFPETRITFLFYTSDTWKHDWTTTLNFTFIFPIYYLSEDVTFSSFLHNKQYVAISMWIIAFTDTFRTFKGFYKSLVLSTIKLLLTQRSISRHFVFLWCLLGVLEWFSFIPLPMHLRWWKVSRWGLTSGKSLTSNLRLKILWHSESSDTR